MVGAERPVIERSDLPYEGILLEEVTNTKGRCGSVAFGHDPLAIFLEKINNLDGGCKCLIGSVSCTCQKEVWPSPPIVILTDLLQQPHA